MAQQLWHGRWSWTNQLSLYLWTIGMLIFLFRTFSSLNASAASRVNFVCIMWNSLLMRGSAWGFLASQEVKDAKVGNLGLQDRKWMNYLTNDVNIDIFKQNVLRWIGSKSTSLTLVEIRIKWPCEYPRYGMCLYWILLPTAGENLQGRSPFHSICWPTVVTPKASFAARSCSPVHQHP